MQNETITLYSGMHFLPGLSLSAAQVDKSFEVKSPDRNIVLKVETGVKLLWSVRHKGQQIIVPSPISLQLEGGEVMGDNALIRSAKQESINNEIKAINYKKAIIPDQYNQLILNCRNDFGVIFRVYNDAVAYRFITNKKGDLVIKNEETNFNFTDDHQAFLQYVWLLRGGEPFNTAFESLYTEHKISQFKKDSLAYLPLLIDVGNGKKVVILEADLEDYTGMFVDINQSGKGLKGVYAPVPLEEKVDGVNYIGLERADYIAKTVGTRKYPWRAIVISEHDKDLLNQDIVQKLSSPPRLADISWIEPGQVSWDWWNATNISHVNFRAGMNTATYKYFIDFASSYKIKYIILDGGWSRRNDLSKSIPATDLPELVEYGKQKNVGLVLWASWYNILRQMDTIFPIYSKMGIKGLKIDFIDRDDQKAVASTYEIARKAATYHLLVDYHGIYKPTGLQRTYPNVVGFEGVKGMEWSKMPNIERHWEDVPRYDVTIPFIRMVSGPMDYTPGAMRNSNRANYRYSNTNPMSQGTRCHQLAMYVIYESPFQMLSDNPTIYLREQECTDFITKVPVTFDETVALDGEVGEYAMLARRKGKTWFAGAMTNWTQREIEIDFSFLGDGEYNAVIFRDGINADRDPTDYVKDEIKIYAHDKLKIKLLPGGGWAARLEKL